MGQVWCLKENEVQVDLYDSCQNRQSNQRLAGQMQTHLRTVVAFTLKMVLLMLAACNAAWFHGRDSLGRLDGIARLQMVLSSLIWLAVLACGRWIAYV
jgi:hypothetical protein